MSETKEIATRTINPLNPVIPPEIKKVDEYLMMLKLIDKGLWKTVNLARALGIDDETVGVWKKTEPVKKLYAATVLKFVARRKDEEKILNELEVESKVDPSALNQFNIYTQLSDEQLDKLIASKGAEVGIPQDIAGETTQDAAGTLEVRETTPETN